MLGDKVIIVDSDGLIGLIHSVDPLHPRCLRIAAFLQKNNYETYVPFPIVLEAATVLVRDNKINQPGLARKLLEDQATTIIPPGLDSDVRAEVAVSFKKNASRKNTPFDHYLCALAKKNGIKYVFSFDSFYKTQGLVLAEELLSGKRP